MTATVPDNPSEVPDNSSELIVEPVRTQPRKLTWGERLSDRFNPILVREVQQAINGRVFLATTWLALAAIVVLALVIAIEGQRGMDDGREYFVASLVILMPIIIFIVPLQAFMSMRLEVTGGTAEQLLLSELTPRRIVRGKILAAMVQFLLYLGVFAPVIALTFLLRGVDIALISFMLVFACLACLCATAVAIALGSMSRWKQIQSITLAFAGLALGATTMGLMGGMWEITNDLAREMAFDRSFWWGISTVIVAGVHGLALCALVASSTLTHPYENRSTPFRVLALSAVLCGFALLWVNPWGDWDEGAPALAMGLAYGFVPFGIFAVTEDAELSPRVRTLVPKRPFSAGLSIPFLPGGARGLLLTLVLMAVAMLLAFVIPFVMLGKGPNHRILPMAFLSWLYVVFFLTLTYQVRRWLRPGSFGTWAGRFAAPLLVGLSCFLPAIIDLIGSGRVHRWHVLHVLNPPFTIASNWRRLELPIVVMSILAGVVLLTALPGIVRAISEVTSASEKRRADAA